MSAFARFRSLAGLTVGLIRQTRAAGEWHGGPRKRFLALIRRYQATNGCTVCAEHPEASYSHSVAEAVIRRGATAGVLITMWGAFVWLTLGPRDSFGWRRGGISDARWEWTGVTGLMGRFERGGW